MLSFHMFVATPPRRALTSFPGPTPTPRPPTRNSHGINLFADPHALTPVASIFYKNIGGRGRLQLTPLGTPKFPSRIPFSFQPLARCPSRNSFLLITIHFHGGVGDTLLFRTSIPYFLSPIPSLFIFLRTLLHFLAFMQNSTHLFSSGFALFAKNTAGGEGSYASGTIHSTPPRNFFSNPPLLLQSSGMWLAGPDARTLRRNS